MSLAPAFRALALQTACHAVNGSSDAAEARARIARNIDRIGHQIRAAKGFIGADVKLVVLPEYFATGFPLGEPLPTWADKAAFDIDGPEYARLGRIAQDHGVYLSGNAYERDPQFAPLYFQTSFVLDDAGKVILRYRRLVSLYAPSPVDVWDAYLDRHGIDGVFPVADTPLGRLACIASEEILIRRSRARWRCAAPRCSCIRPARSARPNSRPRTSPSARVRWKTSPSWCRPIPAACSTCRFRVHPPTA